MSRSKPPLIAIDTAAAWESMQRWQMDTIPVARVVPWSSRRHRFPTCRDQREVGFMPWAGRSWVLKVPGCLQEETEMRKIRLRLANGNLGAKWQNSVVVKGSATATTVPTAMPLTTPRWPPTDTGSSSCKELEKKAPGCPRLWLWIREVPPELTRESWIVRAETLSNENPSIKIDKWTFWRKKVHAW